MSVTHSYYLSIYLSIFQLLCNITLLFQLRLSSLTKYKNNYHATSNMHNTWDQRNLVQQTVGHSCSGQACHGRLVRYPDNGKSAEFSFLRDFGRRLNNLAPCTFRNLSLARFTLLGALLGMLAGTVNLPRLSLHCHLISNPCINLVTRSVFQAQ